MKQSELADAVGVSRPYMHDIEIGARKGKAETLDKIAAALGVTREELTQNTVA